MSKILILAVIAATTFASLAAEQVKQPNIIFILTDDQGYGDLERHGHPLLKTPNTNLLYDESVRFDHFYVSPSCSPTRAALMTGMHEFRNGITHTVHPREHLFKDAVTLPQLLKTAGYATGFIGKWHLGGGNGYNPQDRGFEWTSTNAGGPHVHFDPDFIRNGVREKRKGFREDLFFDEAMNFIEESKDKPFFCYLATYSPHTPLGAPEEFVAPFRNKVKEEKHAVYLGMIENIDYNVGRLLRFLEDKGIDENTILVFMNDNGVTEGLDVYNAGMRGCKCTAWEGGTRAISFWRWPGKWQPHQVDHLTAHLDVLPTLCELASVAIPETLKSKLEGFSLVPLLNSAEPTSWHDDRMLFHHVARWPSGLAKSHKHAMAGARKGNLLLVRSDDCGNPACEKFQSQCATQRQVRNGQTTTNYANGTAQFHCGVTPKGQWSLFNVKKDPACRNDLAASHPETIAEMAKAYDGWWDNVFPDMIARGGDHGDPNENSGSKTPKANKKKDYE